MATLTALRCAVCADQTLLSTAEPVAAAEIAGFMAVHAQHDQLAIEVVIPTQAV